MWKIEHCAFFGVVMINDKAKRSLCASQSYYQVKWQRYIGGNIASKLFCIETSEEFSCLKTNFAVIFSFYIQGKFEQNFFNFHVLVLYLSKIRLNLLFSPIMKIPLLSYPTKPSFFWDVQMMPLWSFSCRNNPGYL